MQTGDSAPDFQLADQHGTVRSLSGLLSGGPVVLFFYPAAMTAGCTAESCRFRDLATEFATFGAQPVGISTDSSDKQAQFAAKNGLEFPLLSDPDCEAAEGFGVRRKFGPLPIKRHTFIIDRDLRVLEVIRSELRMAAHADGALAFLRKRI